MRCKILFFSLILLCEICISNTCKSQDKNFTLKKKSEFFSIVTIEPNENRSTKLNLKSQTSFTSIAFKIRSPFEFKNGFVNVNGQRINIEKDGHSLDGNDELISQLIHFPSLSDEIEFFSGEMGGSMEILLFNGEFSGSNKPKSIIKGSCEEPLSVDQKIWRKDLDKPNYSRDFSKVNHIILHHSAGSNNSTDFYQVVRDIYLYHTKGKGWSDIGYNYLIAPDGTIFKGRDPEIGEQDNVKGAHFCGKNTGTMGVCILGTYTSVPPSSQAIESFVSLSTWKYLKEEISPNETFNHNGVMLGALAGHRDGCATECPGNQSYLLLPQLISKIENNIKDCQKEDSSSVKVYPIPSNISNPITIEGSEKDTLNLVRVYNQLGQEIYTRVQKLSNSQFKVYPQNIQPGLYHLVVEGLREKYFFKVLIIR